MSDETARPYLHRRPTMCIQGRADQDTTSCELVAPLCNPSRELVSPLSKNLYVTPFV